MWKSFKSFSLNGFIEEMIRCYFAEGLVSSEFLVALINLQLQRLQLIQCDFSFFTEFFCVSVSRAMCKVALLHVSKFEFGDVPVETH